MINIIKKGTLYPYQTTCLSCGCIFEFQDEDIKEKWVLTADKTIYSIECLTCGETLFTFNKNDWRK